MVRWIVVTACLVGLRAASAQERPLEARIREANLKATKALAAKWARVEPGTTTYGGHARTLVALALLRAGGPEERVLARKLLDDWWLDAVSGRVGDHAAPGRYANYVVSLGVSALEALTLEPVRDDSTTLTRFEKRPVPRDLEKRLEIATKALLDSAVKLGPRARAWGYATVPFVLGATRSATSFTDWDDSNTQFTALAFHDAARGGVAIPKEAIDGLVEHFAGSLGPGDGPVRWSYRDEKPRLSMTFAALSSLAVARSLGSRDPRIETALRRGALHASDLRGLSPSSGGEHGTGAAYAICSLEKALDLLEVETVDGKEWFPPLAEKVLAARDARGLWGGGDLVDSCLYVLFLVRATFGASRIGRAVTKASVARERIDERRLDATIGK